MKQRYLLAAKGLVTGRILDVSRDHEPSEAEIEFAEDFFGTEEFEFFIYEE